MVGSWRRVVCWYLPALRGRGTPPTNTVLRGSKGIDASKTKSASDKRQGRICTGLSFIVGEETHKYNLSSSVIQASINCWTEVSSLKNF